MDSSFEDASLVLNKWKAENSLLWVTASVRVTTDGGVSTKPFLGIAFVGIVRELSEASLHISALVDSTWSEGKVDFSVDLTGATFQYFEPRDPALPLAPSVREGAATLFEGSLGVTSLLAALLFVELRRG